MFVRILIKTIRSIFHEQYIQAPVTVLSVTKAAQSSINIPFLNYSFFIWLIEILPSAKCLFLITYFGKTWYHEHITSLVAAFLAVHGD
jgi:hypothetical protein